MMKNSSYVEGVDYFECHKLFSIFFSLVLMTACVKQTKAEVQEMQSTVNVQGQTRDFLVYKPQRLNTKPALMLMLHGGFGNAESMRRNTRMDKVADKNGFVVVYANGVGGRLLKNRRTWNAGKCCGKAVRKNSNDILYLERIIDKMVSEHGVDAKRVYITGFSNGAMMAYRMACEKPQKIAAIIPVSGTITINNCNKGNAVGVMHIHGENDENVPIIGGKGKRSVSGVEHKSVQQTINIIKASRQCKHSVKTLHDQLKLETLSCKNGADIHLYTIKNEGHKWMKKPFFSASEMAWKFAKNYSK